MAVKTPGLLPLVVLLSVALFACSDDPEPSSSNNQDDDSGVTDGEDWWDDEDWWADSDDDFAGDGTAEDSIDYDGPPRFADVERECEYGETQVCRCTEEQFNSERECISYDWGPCHCSEEEDDEYSAFVIENLNPDDEFLLLAQGDSTGEVIGVLTEEDEVGTRFTGVLLQRRRRERFRGLRR